MRIGILECGRPLPDVQATHGTFADMFARLLDGHGFEFTAYHVEEMVFPDNVHDQDGWLISGSKHGAYEDHAFVPPLEDFIREAFAQSIPMIGICFGHQIIAQALGGKVEKFAGGWAVGRRTYDLKGSQVAINAWHQDQVVELPPNAEVIGSNEFCANAALEYGQTVFTLQPHPEFDGPLIADYVRLRRNTADYPETMMDDAAANTELPLDQAKVGDQMARFFLAARAVQHA